MFFEEKFVKRLMGWGIFLILTAVYWSTMPPEVSYWDCPEYVASARLLEVGHPPGNPAWMLFHRVVTMLAPAPQYVALSVNMASGVFMALASMLIALTLYPLLRRLTRRLSPRFTIAASAVASTVAALCYGVCDSAWYSAVEAEVYAMSAFFTALTVWLTIKTTPLTPHPLPLSRTLILLAYLTGLTLGVHQLNLLVLPAIAVILLYSQKRRPGRLTALIAFCCGLAGVAMVLYGMMPSTVSLAGIMELFTVNRLHLPYNSGTVAYAVLLILSAAIAIGVCRRSNSRMAVFVAAAPFLFLSGIFIYADSFIGGAIISIAVAAAAAFYSLRFSFRRAMLTSLWMIAMTLTGYSVYAVVLLRGDIPSQANSVFPGNPFTLKSYIARDQYGSNPLLYGRTSYSRKMLIEETAGEGKPVYSRLALIDNGRIRQQWISHARINDRYRMLNASDSQNNAAVNGCHHGYLTAGNKIEARYTPELDMWFPRIHGNKPGQLLTYREWTGMEPATMDSVSVSEAFDAEGNAVGRKDVDGKRERKVSHRPTYMQNLEWFLSYQTYYMYVRYLLWNFAGRQNDIPSSGEAEHGNFITGIDAIDNMMLGEGNVYYGQDDKPNKGRNVYYMIPFLLGVAGIVYLCRGGRLSRRACRVIFLLFIMTGFAIVVYLNQTPNEPRERDYSFLGSYMAFAAWTGCGAMWIILLLRRLIDKLLRKRLPRRIATAAALLLPLGVPAMMWAVNLDDHDRSGRRVAANCAINVLESLDPQAIIFVEGDNRTFPLWYAQEVLGVRTDVRVVNLSYLSIPEYLNALRCQWRESKPVRLTSRAGDVAFDAFILPTLPDSVADRTLPATEALAEMYASGKDALPAGQLYIDTGGDSLIINLREIIRENGFRSLPFRRLAMIDIIATNAASASPRPVYWMHTATKQSYAGMKDFAHRDLLTYRLGKVRVDSTQPLKAIDIERLREKARLLLKPNGDAKDVYMDETPRRMVESEETWLRSLLIDD